MGRAMSTSVTRPDATGGESRAPNEVAVSGQAGRCHRHRRAPAVLVLSFAAMEQTFRLFTEDEFHLSVRGTSYVLGFVGVVLILVQSAAIRPLSRAFGERALVTAGVLLEALGFAALALSAGRGSLPLLYGAMGVIALGSGLTNPSLSALVSRACGSERQGATLGVLQSAGAFARVCGPATGGALYQGAGHVAPYIAAAVGMVVAAVLSRGLARTDSLRES